MRTDRQTDRQTDRETGERTEGHDETNVAFLHFKNAPKNEGRRLKNL